VEIHKDQNFPSDAKDEEWLPIIGSKGWVIVTSDRRIWSRQVEIAALLRSGAASFVLTAASATAAQNADSFLKALPDVLGCLKKFPRPFVAQITASGRVSILATHSALVRRLG
jgi:hypothetical protein